MTADKPIYNVVAAVVWDQGEILCVQKPKTRFDYTSFHWEYPGGKVEAGETEAEAMCRELMEEMAYPIEVLAPLAEVEYMYPDFGVRLHCHLCRPADKEHPRQFVLKEHAASRWIHPCDVPLMDWCAADYELQVNPDVVEVLEGTPFQKQVWRALCAIPKGETRSYGEMAKMIGKPGAVRAVGHACHVNPLPYFVPCHRVVASDGSLGGYALGLEKKVWLLEQEKRNQEAD